MKSDIADCLHHRAKQIRKWESVLADERKHVQKVLMANGYPKQALCIRRRGGMNAEVTERRARVFLPYIKGISEKISSMQATGCTDGLHFQEYPQEIPHESEGKTRDD